MIRPPPRSKRTVTLLPYTTLFRSAIGGVANGLGRSHNSVGFACLILIVDEQDISGDSNDRDKDDGDNYTPAASPAFNDGGGGSLYHPLGYPFVSHVTLLTDRKSTRMNSSH